MRKKQWLIAAAIIIAVLAFALFSGGNHGTKTAKNIESTIKSTLSIENSSTTTKEHNTQEYNKQTAADSNRTNTNTAVSASQKETGQSTSKPGPDEKNMGATSSDASGKKDKYLTDPVPEGKPKPIEWQDIVVNKDKKLTCTLSVTCRTILDNMDKFNKDKLEVLPADGIILKTQTVTFSEGESVFDVLLREMKKNKIHMEFEMTPIYNSNYIEGIHNLYEFDCGELSGWMYKVNGWFPNYGCSRYALKDGDVVEWIYTCDLGRDIGGGMAVGGKKP